MKKIIVLLSFTFVFNSLVVAQSRKESKTLLFFYFKGNGEDGLHIASSKDGMQWAALGNDSSFLMPMVGKDKLMRDPSIIYGPDGFFHMVWTVSWKERGIGYSRSKDLINWSEQQYLPVMEHEQGAQNCWAPEISYDYEHKSYFIYWASTISGRFKETEVPGEKNHRIYSVTTKDFKSFGQTKLLYNKGFNVIDASIQKYKNGYLMFLKDETKYPTAKKNILISYSKNIDGPYSAPSLPITGNYWAEGPTAVMIKGRWTVYFDKYEAHKYGAVVSNDLKNWEDVSDKLNMPEGARHGSVIWVNDSIVKKLVR
ncbi:beta-galactosidase [Pedobacter ginsenosidimutans]|uniref:Beta-galactosidase n=1 Tax=Pedobacter ginsenosidimutans TaxID=687842 RepID=A0A0T5VWM5_9SPHI|nr:glycoside hydrolase family 43 protein [Pedobacter ginsenosidimutans]KRT18208.1 beta-galactosidase [Pedobacter ginsenosidimutans]